MIIKKEGKEIDLGYAKKVNEFGKIFGLMFSHRKRANSLLFKFKKPVKMKIHSWFVFFPFFVIWLDKKNNVLDMRKVNPFRFNIGTDKFYYKLVEIPFNKKNKRLLQLLDGD